MFLKEKREGQKKGHGVADRRKQQEKIEPKDAISPTVSMEEVVLTATIDAIEGRDVAVVDIPESYLSADMDNKVHVVFIRKLAEMMVAANPAPSIRVILDRTGGFIRAATEGTIWMS